MFPRKLSAILRQNSKNKYHQMDILKNTSFQKNLML